MHYLKIGRTQNYSEKANFTLKTRKHYTQMETGVGKSGVPHYLSHKALAEPGFEPGTLEVTGADVSTAPLWDIACYGDVFLLIHKRYQLINIPSRGDPFRLLLVYFHCRTCGLSDQWDVGLMGCRTYGLSNYWHLFLLFEFVGCRTNGLSDLWAVGLMGMKKDEIFPMSDLWAVGLMDCRTYGGIPTEKPWVTQDGPCWSFLVIFLSGQAHTPAHFYIFPVKIYGGITFLWQVYC